MDNQYNFQHHVINKQLQSTQSQPAIGANYMYLLPSLYIFSAYLPFPIWRSIVYMIILPSTLVSLVNIRIQWTFKRDLHIGNECRCLHMYKPIEEVGYIHECFKFQSMKRFIMAFKVL